MRRCSLGPLLIVTAVTLAFLPIDGLAGRAQARFRTLPSRPAQPRKCCTESTGSNRL